MKTTTVTRVIFLHYTLKRVEDWNRDTPERSIMVLAMPNNLEAEWEENWARPYGKLIHVKLVEESFQMPDPIQTELEVLSKEITLILAEAEIGVKSCRDRINDLMMLGYDSGSAQVVDVEVEEPSDDHAF